MTDKRYQLSRRKALAGLATVGVAGAGAGLGTSALYQDEERLNNNTITAGTANLEVTLGLVSIDSSAPNALGINLDTKEDVTADGGAVTGVQVGDMKPGDCVTLRATVDVTGNPMYVAAEALNQDDAENGESDPESTGSGPDTGGDPIGDGNDDDAGDLDNELDVVFGWDNNRGNLHDNTLEGGFPLGGPEFTGSLTDFIGPAYLGSGVLYRGQNGASGSPPGGHSSATDPKDSATRIGDDTTASNVDRDKVTHFIELCLPQGVGNNVQGDSVSFDLRWAAEQVRNNSVSSASDIL